MLPLLLFSRTASQLGSSMAVDLVTDAALYTAMLVRRLAADQTAALPLMMAVMQMRKKQVCIYCIYPLIII